MKLNIKFIVLLFVVLGFSKADVLAQTSKYKCLIQMVSYEGEAAYVVVSLVNKAGAYEKTLAVLGTDKQWYNTLKDWYKYQTKAKEKLSAVTGASIGGGDRAIKTLEIDDAKMNKGYTLRFESAVEEQKYHVTDVEIPLTTAGITEMAKGKGYIKMVKLNKVQ